MMNPCRQQRARELKEKTPTERCTLNEASASRQNRSRRDARAGRRGWKGKGRREEKARGTTTAKRFSNVKDSIRRAPSRAWIDPGTPSGARRIESLLN